jgi:hypothetical protein
VAGGASSCERVQGTGVRLPAGVSGQCPLGGEPQDYRLEQLRYPLRVGAGVERPGRLPPSRHAGEQFALAAVGGAGGRLESGVALGVAPAVQGDEQPVGPVMLVLAEVPRRDVADALHAKKRKVRS